MRIQFPSDLTAHVALDVADLAERANRPAIAATAATAANPAPWQTQAAPTGRAAHLGKQRGVGKRLSNAPRRRAY